MERLQACNDSIRNDGAQALLWLVHSTFLEGDVLRDGVRGWRANHDGAGEAHWLRHRERQRLRRDAGAMEQAACYRTLRRGWRRRRSLRRRRQAAEQPTQRSPESWRSISHLRIVFLHDEMFHGAQSTIRYFHLRIASLNMNCSRRSTNILLEDRFSKTNCFRRAKILPLEDRFSTVERDEMFRAQHKYSTWGSFFKDGLFKARKNISTSGSFFKDEVLKARKISPTWGY